jgi:hypothetical protein
MKQYVGDLLGGVPSLTLYQIQAKAKNILASVMYYHMAAMDREKIFNKHQLTGLANNLGKDLTGDLAKWVKETYGPAYTSLLIVQGYNTKDWLIKFTEKEKAKILYFWQGNVSHSSYDICCF